VAPDVAIALLPDGKPTEVIYGAGFTLQLRPGRTIKGRVIDRDSREPIPGMWVGPLQNAVNEFSSSLYPWVTDAKGRFTITGPARTGRRVGENAAWLRLPLGPRRSEDILRSRSNQLDKGGEDHRIRYRGHVDKLPSPKSSNPAGSRCDFWAYPNVKACFRDTDSVVTAILSWSTGMGTARLI
jgi:hypothetical protein